jgi:hypothetical protein
MSDASHLLPNALPRESVAARLARLPAFKAHRVFVGIGALVALIAVVGFWPTYFGPLVRGVVDKPFVIHVHAAVFSGWVALFIAQAVFAATGRLALHRQLGQIGIYYGFAIIAVGLITAFAIFSMRVEAGDIAQGQTRLFAPVTDMLVFPIFFGAAVYYRKKPELHKRFMLVATTILLVAAVGRMTFLADIPMARLAVWLSPIFVGMAYDLYTKRLVHPIYLAGIVAIALVNQRRPLADTDPWQGLTGWLAGLMS